ncbi:MAG: hypothetical protein HN904_28780, partial [Victivallales bacterium]|nr:hypothetical protein [Victivallales bacterium]
MTDLMRRYAFLGTLIVGVSVCVTGQEGGAQPPLAPLGGGVAPQFRIDDARLLASVCVPVDPVMPERLFTPAIRERIRKGEAGTRTFFSVRRDPAAGERWLAVPEARWREAIVGHAPLTLTRCGGTCPFCGKRLSTVSCDLAQTPFVGRTGCCGATVYGREGDMPAGYPARPNHAEVIPHLDGTHVEYRFHVPDGAGNDR